MIWGKKISERRTGMKQEGEWVNTRQGWELNRVKGRKWVKGVRARVKEWNERERARNKMWSDEM